MLFNEGCVQRLLRVWFLQYLRHIGSRKNSTWLLLTTLLSQLLRIFKSSLPRHWRNAFQKERVRERVPFFEERGRNENQIFGKERGRNETPKLEERKKEQISSLSRSFVHLDIFGQNRWTRAFITVFYFLPLFLVKIIR